MPPVDERQHATRDQDATNAAYARQCRGRRGEQVRSRTVDLLPVVISVAEILRDVDLADQQAELMLRLDLGIPRDLVGLARLCRGRLTRAEYLRLRTAGLGTLDALSNMKADHLAEHLGGREARSNTVI